MPLPKYKDFFSDVLEVLHDGNQYHRRALYLEVIDRLDLSDSEKSEIMKGGGSRERSRVHWAFEDLF